MGEGVITEAPHRVSSLGLGSCVVVTLYNTQRQIGGMAHIMLPDSSNTNGHHTPYQCADTAIDTLLKKLHEEGVSPNKIVAKMVGGARMFSTYNGSDPGIGQQNIAAIKHLLKERGIALTGQDVGGYHGRNAEFYLDSGRVMVKAFGKEDKEI